MTTSSGGIERARRTYATAHWGGGYVDIDNHGDLLVCPRRSEGPALSLPRLVDAARASGLRLPLLLRFPDILADRLARMQTAFAEAMEANGYAGRYTAVYPIKVNQQRSVVGELARAGRGAGAAGSRTGFGLEAGSKPELMAVLALAHPGSRVICNGYKDRQYVRLALIGRRLGLDVVIVIEKPSELEHVIVESRALGIEPRLGVRVRLASIGAGKWQNTGGGKGKFGLGPRQVLALVERLDACGLTRHLNVLHFHMGSQISNVRDIASGMREAIRHYIELRKRGLPLDTLDIGGGLGVDYEGTRSRSFNSINYSMVQYAHAVVQPLAEACREHDIPMPDIVTEAGRAMTAHHAVLVVDVGEVEAVPDGSVPPPAGDEPAVVRHLREVHAALDERPPTELYHEARFHITEGQALYALGQLDLGQRARLDDLYYAIMKAVRTRLNPAERTHRAVLDELDAWLVDKYFGNFSVFESIPDVWAIDQVFPIMPIARLDEEPTRRGVLVDVTCDSDGRIDHYVGAEGLDMSLPLHALRPGEPYRLGVFMVGAYQETLGDIHNLFGDTDAVNVRLDGDGWRFDRSRRGDTANLMLEYVGYDLDAMRHAYAGKLAAAGVHEAAAVALQAELEAGLTAYTYLQ